jgi:hypothetical protein
MNMSDTVANNTPAVQAGVEATSFLTSPPHLWRLAHAALAIPQLHPVAPVPHRHRVLVVRGHRRQHASAGAESQRHNATRFFIKIQAHHLGLPWEGGAGVGRGGGTTCAEAAPGLSGSGAGVPNGDVGAGLMGADLWGEWVGGWVGGWVFS